MELRLKELRKSRNLSQEDMAQSLEVKKSRYGTWERGERMMNLEQAYNCAIVLGCTLNDLVGMSSSRVFADPRQGRINEQYEEMNDRGQQRIADSVDDIHSNPANLKSEVAVDSEGATRRTA